MIQVELMLQVSDSMKSVDFPWIENSLTNVNDKRNLVLFDK